MKILITVFIILFSTQSFSADMKMTKDEFLKKLDNKSLTLERTPILSMNYNLLKPMMDAQRKRFPGFKDEMFYTAYVESTNYRYFIYYEWFDRGCVFGITKPQDYKGLSDKASWDNSTNEYNSYQKIDNKYCEQELSMTIPSSKGLTEIPKAMLNK